jgi:hypothetical protein
MSIKTKIFCFLCFVLSISVGYSQCPSGYISTGTERAVNGDFDAGNSGFTSSYTYVANNADPTIKDELWPEGTYSVWSNPNELHSGFSACTDLSGSGNMLVVNGSSTANVALWTQTISVTPATLYYFVTEVTSVNSASPAQLQFSVNNVLLGSVFNASATTCQWNKFYSTWNSAGNSSVTISIVNQNTASSGNDFALDKISFIPCTATLPVDLIQFEVSQKKEKEVNVFWQTASETNNDFFTVERSGGDNEFESLANISSKASNSKIRQNYSFIDKCPLPGISYYRLQQTDIDGNTKYSNIVSLKTLTPEINCDVLVYPNPSFSKVSVNYSGDVKDIVSVSVCNIYGEMIYESPLFQPELDFENIKSGFYILRIILKSNKSIEKRFLIK